MMMMMAVMVMRTMFCFVARIELFSREQHHEDVNDDDDVQHRY